MTADAIHIHHQKKAINAYRTAGATDAHHARALEDLKVGKSLAVRSLISKGVLVEHTPDRYYLNIEKADALPRQRLIRIGIILALIAMAMFIIAITL